MKDILVKDKDGTWKVWRDGEWLMTEAPITAALGAGALPVKFEVPPVPAAVLSTSLPPTHPPPPLSPSQSELPHSSKISESKTLEEKPHQEVKIVAESMEERIEELTKKISREINVANFDADLRARLENIIRLRLREVRDTVDTRETLLRKKINAGLELSDQIADEIIGIILKYLPQTHRPFVDLAAVKESGALPPSVPVKSESEKVAPTNAPPSHPPPPPPSP